MQQRGEPHTLTLSRRLAHGCQSMRRGTPALSPDRGCLTAVSLGRGPSLHGLRRGQALLVRPLLRYCNPVRLLIRVHVHRSAVAFLNRPGIPVRARMRSPRFRTKDVSTCMGSPTARGPAPASPFAGADVAFSSTERDRHLGIRPVSQLNTQPVVSPVNASRRPSRDAAHHSGPGRLARPYPVEDLHLLSFASFPGALRSGSNSDHQPRPLHVRPTSESRPRLAHKSPKAQARRKRTCGNTVPNGACALRELEEHLSRRPSFLQFSTVVRKPRATDARLPCLIGQRIIDSALLSAATRRTVSRAKGPGTAIKCGAVKVSSFS
jgi:hypothetical protein